MGAAARAQEVSVGVTRGLQQNVAPTAKEAAGQVAGQAAGAAAVVASGGAQAVQTWLEDTEPARRDAMEKAQARFSSLWQTVRATSSAAASSIGEGTQRLAANYGQAENIEGTAAKLGSVAGAAVSAVEASSKVVARVAVEATRALAEPTAGPSAAEAEARAHANNTVTFGTM